MILKTLLPGSLAQILLFLTVVSGGTVPFLDVLGPNPVNGAVSAQFTSKTHTFDAPHLSAINSTVFEWWYFDLISADASTALAVIFFTSTPGGFALLEGNPSDIAVSVNAKLPNGTFISTAGEASKAVIASQGILGDGVAGEYNGVGSFVVSPNLNEAVVSFDTTAQDPNGMKGTICFRSTSPAHIPCSASLAPNQPLSVLPHLGWTNAIPDSSPSGTFTLSNGESHTFTSGSGYHDHNWGDIPFIETINSWYWGHVHLGPWSLVFFSGLDPTGADFSNSYVAHNGEVLVASCKTSSITAIPTNGEGGDGDLKKLEVEFPIDGKRTVRIEITPEPMVQVPDVYYRWTGSVTGGLVGGKQFKEGVSVLERFLPLS